MARNDPSITRLTYLQRVRETIAMVLHAIKRSRIVAVACTTTQQTGLGGRDTEDSPCETLTSSWARVDIRECCGKYGHPPGERIFAGNSYHE